MRIHGAIAFLLCVLSAACLAHADVNVGDAPDLSFTDAISNNAVKLTDLHGKLVIVDFWASWCHPCMDEAPHMVALNTKYAPLGVQMIGISLDQSRGDMQGAIKDKNFTWPQFFDGQGWQNKFATAWGVQSIPQTFLISTDGTVLWRGHPAQIDPELEKAYKEHPPQLVEPKLLADANALLDKVDAAIAAKDFQTAMKTLAKAPAAARADAKFAQRQDDLKKSLNDAAESILDDVSPLIDKKQYSDAAARLRAIAIALDGSPLAKEAMHRLSDLKKIPEAAKALDLADKADKADAALAAADKLKADKHDTQAYARYKSITKDFAGTPAADKAAAAVKAYDSDPAFSRKISDANAAAEKSKADGMLSLARNYAAMGNTAKARAKYQELIDHYPQTDQATAAKAELAKLPGE